MITLTEAELLAPAILGLIEQTLKAVDPSLEAKLEKYLPSVEKVASALIRPDAAAIKTELVSLQMDAVDRLTASLLGTAST